MTAPKRKVKAKAGDHADAVLHLGWEDFCKGMMDLDNAELKLALAKEVKGKNRVSYVNRIKARLRQQAYESAV